MDLDRALSGRRDLARTVHNAVDNAVNPSGARATRLWGVQITRLELTTIDVVAGPLEPNNSL
jgi:regulator of protease activity HflC (stomatin/prohibitin superfamily)